MFDRKEYNYLDISINQLNNFRLETRGYYLEALQFRKRKLLYLAKGETLLKDTRPIYIYLFISKTTNFGNGKFRNFLRRYLK
jgi:hypothetical protein